MAKILVIDDEPNLVLGISAILENEQYAVVVAYNGMDGLALAQQEHPDLIICDIMMPKMNGVQLKKEISKDTALHHIPFIYLTARASKTDLLTGFASGADDYITKPFDVAELLSRVRAILKRQIITMDISRTHYESKVEEVKQRVSTMMAHEMRTPVGLALSALEIISQEKNNLNPHSFEKYLNLALANTTRLRWLIEDMLLLYDLDNQCLTEFLYQPFNAQFDVQDIVSELSEHWAEKETRVYVDIQDSNNFYIPKACFRHILRHLLDNAYKFSAHNHSIRLTLRSEENQKVHVCIEDEAIGIPPQEIPHIFERFYQVSQGIDRQYQGLGLGLYLAHEITEKLHGTLAVANRTPDQAGVRVDWCIPFHRPSATARFFIE